MKKELTGMITCAFLLTSFSNVYAAPINDRDCDEFASSQEVMKFWESNGYSASNDPHDLDRDGDGLACEVSQSEYTSFTANEEDTLTQLDTSERSETKEIKVAAETSGTEQGEQLPDTAANSLLITLMSAGLVGVGSLLLFRRKKNHA